MTILDSPYSAGTVDCCRVVQCVTGTSVGSIIALYLALKKGSAQEALNLIQQNASQIISKGWFAKWRPAWVSSVAGWKNTKYDSKGIAAVLKKIFDELRYALKECASF